MNDIKAAVNQPEHLSQYIDIAIELNGKKEDGCRWEEDELSHGEWACLAGMREGLYRGREEKQSKAKAEENQRWQQIINSRRQ